MIDHDNDREVIEDGELRFVSVLLDEEFARRQRLAVPLRRWSVAAVVVLGAAAVVLAIVLSRPEQGSRVLPVQDPVRSAPSVVHPKSQDEFVRRLDDLVGVRYLPEMPTELIARLEHGLSKLGPEHPSRAAVEEQIAELRALPTELHEERDLGTLRALRRKLIGALAQEIKPWNPVDGRWQKFAFDLTNDEVMFISRQANTLHCGSLVIGSLDFQTNLMLSHFATGTARTTEVTVARVADLAHVAADVVSITCPLPTPEEVEGYLLRFGSVQRLVLEGDATLRPVDRTQALEAVAKLELVDLELPREVLTPEGLAALSGMKRLHTLRVTGFCVDTDGMLAAALPRFVSLQNLEVHWVRENSVFEAIADTRIETLQLVYPWLTRAGLDWLRRLSTLRDLTLDTAVTDTVIDGLTGWKGLRRLRLRSVAREVLVQLRSCLPDTAVEADRLLDPNEVWQDIRSPRRR